MKHKIYLGQMVHCTWRDGEVDLTVEHRGENVMPVYGISLDNRMLNKLNEFVTRMKALDDAA